jgi:hypothetical protein
MANFCAIHGIEYKGPNPAGDRERAKISEAKAKSKKDYAKYVTDTEQINQQKQKAGKEPVPILTYGEWGSSYAKYVTDMEQINQQKQKAGKEPVPILTHDEWRSSYKKYLIDATMRNMELRIAGKEQLHVYTKDEWNAIPNKK